MACISKFTFGSAYDCDTGATGIESALIFNKEDIAAYVLSEGSLLLSAFTLVSGAKAYKIDTPKRTLVLTDSLKINEGAPNSFSQSATLVYTSVQGSSNLRGFISSSANTGAVIMAKLPGNVVRVYGLYFGMYATAIDKSTHDNGGWFTITMSTQEQVIGEDLINVQADLYDSLYTAATY